MEWKLTTEPLRQLATDTIIAFHVQGCESTQGYTRDIDEVLGHRISSLIMDGEITGKKGETTLLHNWGKLPSGRVIVTGLGKEDQIDLSCLRDAVAVAARRAQNIGMEQLGIGYPPFLMKQYNSVDVVQAIVEGVELGTRKPHSYKSSTDSKKIKVVWLALQDIPISAAEAGIERGQVFARATNLARFLVDEPANYLTPERLAYQAEQVSQKRGLQVDILEENVLEKLGMHALLAVSRGSTSRPRMIVISYHGAPDSKEVLGLVGKGITFDSGGLQVKPGNKMLGMKGDMAGAAAVIGAMDAIGSLQPHCNVMAVIASCENMVDGNSYRPGDVVSTFSGKTIEINHTDAEGRVVLADALAYARRLGATKLVNVATLTGAVIIALGHITTGLMTNDEEWGDEVKAAARIAGERVWQLPMFEEYKEYIKSDMADMKNSAGVPAAGPIQGGMFLREFVGETPWVHLDIAGTSESESERGVHPKGATGESVRTLIQLAIRFG